MFQRQVHYLKRKPVLRHLLLLTILAGIFLFQNLSLLKEKKGLHFDAGHSLLVGNGLQKKFDQFFLEKKGIFSGKELRRFFFSPQNPGYIEILKLLKDDAHPPLYFYLLSKWNFFLNLDETNYGTLLAGLNALFFLLALLFLYRLLFKIYTPSISFWGTLFFILSPGTLLFMGMGRMYALYILTSILILSALHPLLRKPEPRFRHFLPLTLAGILGLLTHYYSLILLTGIGGLLLFESLLFPRKSLEFFKNSILALSLSFIVSSLVNPFMMVHVLAGYRGKEALGNIKNTFNLPALYHERILPFLHNAYQEVYGIGLYFIFFFLIFCLVFSLIRAIREVKSKGKITSLGFLESLRKSVPLRMTIYSFLLIIFYGSIILTISPYLSSRYLVPLMGLIPLLVCFLLNQRSPAVRFLSAGLLGLSLFFVLAGGFKDRPYLRISAEDKKVKKFLSEKGKTIVLEVSDPVSTQWTYWNIIPLIFNNKEQFRITRDAQALRPQKETVYLLHQSQHHRFTGMKKKFDYSRFEIYEF